ncbi:hypothetical protein J6590_083924 [Homalodisca vitripennis]|nr:hypothetical protein J6590_083924 [Homalodisca vitripennis]
MDRKFRDRSSDIQGLVEHEISNDEDSDLDVQSEHSDDDSSLFDFPSGSDEEYVPDLQNIEENSYSDTDEVVSQNEQFAMLGLPTTDHVAGPSTAVPRPRLTARNQQSNSLNWNM